MGHFIDETFLAQPFLALADAALTAARAAGAEHADFRFQRIRTGAVTIRDHGVQASTETVTDGYAVRVIVGGCWGFASSVVPTAKTAASVARQAIGVARALRRVVTEGVERANEPVYPNATWVSDYDVDPFAVPTKDKIDWLLDASERMLGRGGIAHTSASVRCVKECSFYADTEGTAATQQRVRVRPVLTAIAVDDVSGSFETMRSLAPPVGRGWEYLTDLWDVDEEIETIPATLIEKLKSPSVRPGRYDLVIDPSNLFLTIHESIGHATEYDRAIGYEAAYAGTSFATPDLLGTLQYGSSGMHVTGDRTAPHGLATIGYDDDGVAGQRWDLIRDGLLVGYQVDRVFAHKLGLPRSNGCSYAGSPGHIQIQRMANVSLQPDPKGGSTEDLIAGVDNGIYIVGDKSWSIDMQRYNFQFTGQRFYRIRGGRLDGQLRDVAYQATTTDFWCAMDGIGGLETYVLGGAFNCGKGQPGQPAPVSHGCPSARFRGINILNAAQEGGSAE